jgi:hypothetical protein
MEIATAEVKISFAIFLTVKSSALLSSAISKSVGSMYYLFCDVYLDRFHQIIKLNAFRN